jgi:hypothetical protein
MQLQLMGVSQTILPDPRAFTPTFFDRAGVREALRLFALELYVTGFGADDTNLGEETAADVRPGIPLGGSDGGEPEIHFAGAAYAAGVRIANVRGRVRRGADGTIRWSWAHAMLGAPSGWRYAAVRKCGRARR